MEATASFGYWIRRRRKALDLTQDELARRVGCSLGAIRKLEADERRPSLEMAERLAQVLELRPAERVAFLKVARAELAVDRLGGPTARMDVMPTPRRSNLPIQPTPFIGREQEVAAVKQRLQEAVVRPVSLPRPGGTGKTRLALAGRRRPPRRLRGWGLVRRPGAHPGPGTRGGDDRDGAGDQRNR